MDENTTPPPPTESEANTEAGESADVPDTSTQHEEGSPRDSPHEEAPVVEATTEISEAKENATDSPKPGTPVTTIDDTPGSPKQEGSIVTDEKPATPPQFDETGSVGSPKEQTMPDVETQPDNRIGLVNETIVVDQQDQKPDDKITADGMEEIDKIPVPPPMADISDIVSELTVSKDKQLPGLALNMQWSFGVNNSVPVINMTDEHRDMIAYCCAHTGVLYDCLNNQQYLLQGHSNDITCMSASADKRWLATADIGEDNLIIIWDTYTGEPVRTIFDACPESGIKAIAITPDAKYLATMTASEEQVLAIWDWTIDAPSPICTATLNPLYGVQTFLMFNPYDTTQILSHSEQQCIFYSWDLDSKDIKYYAPPLTDSDFNRAVGKFTQSIFLKNSTRALTATTQGNLVMWDTNKPLSKLTENQNPTPNKKAVKLVKQQDRAITVITVSDEDYIVTGDSLGHIRFFDQRLKLMNWYQDFKLGPISAISFSYFPDFNTNLSPENGDYPPDATIAGDKFVIRRFVVGTSSGIYASVQTDGTDVRVIHRDHNAAVFAIDTHPRLNHFAVGSYSGLMKVWDYENKRTVCSRYFDRKEMIRSVAYSPKGSLIAAGFTNGSLRLMDAITLEDLQHPFRDAKDAITHIAFSSNELIVAAADAQFTTNLYSHRSTRKKTEDEQLPYHLVGRYRAHYQPIVDLMFGTYLDCDKPRLVTLAADRNLVEYDLERSLEENQIMVLSSERIEQSAVPLCMAWYPPIFKESFIVTANDHYKMKLYNTTTKMCRKTVLGPVYGSPLQKIVMLPTKEPYRDTHYMAYITTDKVGLVMLPLDGNPHKAMALFSHPKGATNLVASHDGRYIFTAGGYDCCVHMWSINKKCLQAQEYLGGKGVEPFYSLMEGGEEGALHKELEDYFYYAQLRSQGMNTMETRFVSSTVPVSEVPYIMRALGYYPTEQEIQEMLNEVKYSQYVETGAFKTEIDLDDFIKLYVNHRPAFGLQPEELLKAFQILGDDTTPLANIDRADLLDLLQTRGEPMTEIELAECLATLMGFSGEGGTAEEEEFDPSTAADLIDENLPMTLNADTFANTLLGLGLYSNVLNVESEKAAENEVAKRSNTTFSQAVFAEPSGAR